jgi:predicted short-subunit dehydrogenase-like oxidoreductase (DUF2520 family)
VSEPLHLWIVGAGRFGLALGLALRRAGALGSLTVSGRRPTAPAHPLFPGAEYRYGIQLPPGRLDGVVIAVPDGAVAEVAASLAGVVPPEVPVLHTAGALSLDVLGAIAAEGHPVGSVHALAAVSDPIAGADRLRGASFGMEGEGAAAALAERINAACAGRALHVRPGGKPLYHAAAVFAANYAVVLLGVGERLMARAGIAPEEAREALAGLAAGAVANTALHGPASALTGPVSRGDDATIRLHLARLSAEERPLYCLLGQVALDLARAAGLPGEAASRVEHALGEAD